VQLFANAAGRMIQYQVQEENAGFDVAERLAEVVNQTVENLFVEGCGAHVECRGHASV